MLLSQSVLNNGRMVQEIDHWLQRINRIINPKECSMESEKTISGAISKYWYDELMNRGVSQQTIEEQTGITVDLFENVDARIPYVKQDKLLHLALDLGDPELPMIIGTKSSPQTFGIVGHIILSSETLRDAGNHAVRYSKLMCDFNNSELVEDDENSYFIIEFLSPEYFSVSICEASMSASVKFIREITGYQANPIEIHFQYPAPSHQASYEKYFKAPLKFNQSKNMIVLPKADLDIKLTTHSPYLRDLLRKHADLMLDQMEESEEENIQEVIKNYIVEHLPSGEVSIEMVADHLNMSRWTLSRKLKENGTSFQHLFKQMRKRLAINYLETRNFSVSEVAFLLGFSEPSAFNRAFKNWSGQSPGEFRKARFFSPATGY